ncbi:MAG: response regulator [Gemmatimonadales bacterium]|jgi:diguanylate cyclase (GGDEF)-like protein
MEDRSAATILVVDDDPQTVECVRRALANSLFTIQHAATAEHARRILAELPPALVILNIVLPDVDGRTLLSELRREPSTATIPIFVAFGFFGPQPQDECLRLGATGVLEKPIDSEHLSRVIDSAFAESAADAGESRRDPVTGLLTRIALAEVYQREAAAAKAGARQLTLALLDLDHLSHINDDQGRAVGDQVRRDVGSRLVAVLQDTDAVCRWEEDEYVILLPATEPRDAVRLLNGAQQALWDASIATTFSAGVTTASGDAPLEEAIARAGAVLLRAKARGPSQVLSSEDEQPDAKLTLVVAEDDRVAAALVRHRLERAGFEVLHFANGAEAFSVALERTIALFVLDIRMPGMDGIELLKRLRDSKQHADTPILMLTSLGREEDIVRAFKLGASDYLTKPFSPVELLARVQRLLRQGRT